MNDKELLELLSKAAASVDMCGGDRDCSAADRADTKAQIAAIDEAIKRLSLR